MNFRECKKWNGGDETSLREDTLQWDYQVLSIILLSMDFILCVMANDSKILSKDTI